VRKERKIVGKPDLPATDPAPQQELSENVAVGPGESDALPTAGQPADADLGTSDDAGIDAAALAALQGLGNEDPGASLAGDLAEGDLVAALHSLDVGSIDHALDQLTSSVNLFDLPVIDVSDMGHADS